MKKSAFSLAFATALLAGCHSAETPSKANAARPTEAEVEQKTRAFFAPLGETVVAKESCWQQSPDSLTGPEPDQCTFKVQATQDDGLLRRVSMTVEGKTKNESCEFKPDSAVADKLLGKIEKAFQHDARYKFGKMGFDVFDTFEEPATYLNDCDNAYTLATFLVRSREGVFSADFKESFNLESGAYGLIVSDLKPVSKRPAAVRAAEDSEDANDAPADSGETPRHASKSAESKICVGSCVGPHLDLQSGKVKMLGTGPGYKF